METLRKYILNEVRKVVNEEMGISEEVTAEVKNIINILNEYLADPNNYKYFDWNGDGRSRVYGVEDEFPVFVFGDKLIYLVFRAVVCNSSRGLIGLKDVEKYYFVPDSTTRLNLSFPIIRRDFKKGDTVQIGLRGTRIANTIAHELKHAYQYLNELESTGRMDSDGIIDMDNDEGLGNYKSKKIYNSSRKLHKQNHSKQVKKLGYAMYYIDKREITANVQYLYNEAIQDAYNLEDALYIIDNSSYVQNIKDIRNLIEQLEGGMFGPRVLGYIEQQYNRPIEWILKTLKNGVKELVRGLGRVKMMVQKHQWGNNGKTLGIAQYDRLMKLLKL